MVVIISLSFRLSLEKEAIRKAALSQCPPQAGVKLLAPKKYALRLDEASLRIGVEREQPALLI